MKNVEVTAKMRHSVISNESYVFFLEATVFINGTLQRKKKWNAFWTRESLPAGMIAKIRRNFDNQIFQFSPKHKQWRQKIISYVNDDCLDCSKALKRWIGKILDLKTDSWSVFHIDPLRFGEYVPC